MPQRQHAAAIRAANESIISHLPRGGRRPLYHFTPPFGWMNDPNGLIFYKGQYHLFYQHNPYATHWARMHWGHAASRDLLDWTDLPVALAPSEIYDLATFGGCYSGSAWDAGDELILLYTGCVRRGEEEIQTQNIARSKDGLRFTKDEGNPVIVNPPPGGSMHFRDPKIWRQGEYFYAVLCTSMAGRGCVVLYRGVDLSNWAYRGVLLEAKEGEGWMWECPDFFPLDGQYVLTVSAMAAGDETNLWFAGSFDEKTERFIPHTRGKLDWGRDFYAAQTLLDDKNRRVLIPWAAQRSLRENVPADAPTKESGFCGQLGLPRALHLDTGGQLRFQPIEEMQTLRGEGRREEWLWLDERPYLLARQDSAGFEMNCTFDLDKSTADTVTLTFLHDPLHRTTLTLHLKLGQLLLCRDGTDDVTQGLDRLEFHQQNRLRLQLFFDRNSLEIFVSEGLQTLSANLFPQSVGMEIWLCAGGGRALLSDFDLWTLGGPFGDGNQNTL